MLLGTVDPWGLASINVWGTKPAMEILFEEADIISANVVGIVALETRSDASIPDQPVCSRLALFRVGIGDVASGAAQAAMLPGSVGPASVEMTPEARTPQQIIPEVG
jgi:hypothetical protein